ncbi:protein of unknown function [Agrobacterium pusense]|uniref:GNAT family N-acetyltransferase n=1 Tax=Agrobacterium pusense TaxID=648995 RepID=U4Q7Z5_9HYPH|nr:protein of unknown function [Agrobacterium pusense]
MTYRIDTPATLFDMAELSGANTLVGWAVAREMWSGGETFAMRYGDELVGLFGLYPTETGAEAWFNIKEKAAPHMLRLIRDIRLTLASRSYPEIVVICTTDAGRRIAIASGFHLFESDGEITHGKFVGRGQQGSCKPAETGSGSTAAADPCRSRQATG